MICRHEVHAKYDFVVMRCADDAFVVLKLADDVFVMRYDDDHGCVVMRYARIVGFTVTRYVENDFIVSRYVDDDFVVSSWRGGGFNRLCRSHIVHGLQHDAFAGAGLDNNSVVRSKAHPI